MHLLRNLLEQLVRGTAIWILLTSNTSAFVLFDAMTYLGKPDLDDHGFTKINVIYQQFLYPKGTVDFSSSPSDDAIVNGVDVLNNSCPIVLDIEKWPLFSGANVVKSSLQKYLDVLRVVKLHTKQPVGYYGLLPVRDYYATRKNDLNRRAENGFKNQALRPLAEQVDILYPSLYTFENNPDAWRTFAISAIKDARDLANGKPVYVFLWPRFHESNRLLGNMPIPNKFWQLQLETAAKFADGAVIWGGWDLKRKKKLTWDDKWEWWQTTVKFSESLRASSELETQNCKTQSMR